MKVADGSSIDGITYAVKVDPSVDLSKYKKVEDSDTVDITVTNRGQTSTDNSVPEKIHYLKTHLMHITRFQKYRQIIKKCHLMQMEILYSVR